MHVPLHTAYVPVVVLGSLRYLLRWRRKGEEEKARRMKTEGSLTTLLALLPLGLVKGGGGHSLSNGESGAMKQGVVHVHQHTRARAWV